VIDQVAEPLAKLREMLKPDGFGVDWSPAGDGAIALTVVAGEDACHDCLVPKSVMLDVLDGLFGPYGVEIADLAYPSAGEPGDDHR
jgi:hypothetical protein